MSASPSVLWLLIFTAQKTDDADIKPQMAVAVLLPQTPFSASEH